MEDTEKAAAAVLVIFASIGAIVMAAGIGLLLAFPVMWTWNAVMPYLFGLPVITWGKAWCLYFLTGVLFRSKVSTSK